MSAIFGIWHLDGKPIDENMMQCMQAKVSHYGRDDRAIRTNHNIGFGCCLDKCGVQAQHDLPVYTDEQQGIMLVCDAQIYNRDELLHSCGLTDTANVSSQALILAAYRKWGADCALHINGDFTFAIWEQQKQQLFIARDHLGVRPLFYCYEKSVFAFASDYRALLALPFVSKQFDEVRLYAELSGTYHINPEATCFAQIKSLRQAHILRLNVSGLQKRKYWTPGAGKKIILNNEAEYCKELYDIVADAVKRRVNYSDALIGSELSGGYDSSVVTILAARELKKTKRELDVISWSPPLDCLEIQPGDTRALIEQICQQEGLDCRYDDPRVPANPDDLNAACPPRCGGGMLFRRELRELSARGVRQVFSGSGGDEAISHRASLLELLATGWWRHYFSEVHGQAKGSPVKFCKILVASTVMRLFGPFSYFGDPGRGAPTIIKREFARKMKQRCPRATLQFSINPVKYIESGSIQGRTELTAWLDADYNIQHLFPFMDYRVMDWALSIPRHWHYKQAKNRYIYRKAFAGILPHEFDDYTTKEEVAMMALAGEKKAEAWETIRTLAGQLNRDLFAAYIDWDKLDETMAGSADDFQTDHITKRKIMFCSNIQRILEDVADE